MPRSVPLLLALLLLLEALLPLKLQLLLELRLWLRVLLPLLVVQPLLVVAAAAGSAAAGSSAFTNALATAGPYAAAVVAAYLAAKALDSGGTPTSTAGLTMAKTGGMSDANIFSMPSFESGFAPLGFKQNATNEQADGGSRSAKRT
jgi:hypothetical protein